VPESADIVVNATPIGLFPDVEARLDLDADGLRPGMVVADVIPDPPRTPLIRDAEGRGCTVLDGLGMLVNQGVISVRHWTGIDADAAVNAPDDRSAPRVTGSGGQRWPPTRTQPAGYRSPPCVQLDRSCQTSSDLILALSPSANG
jgi:Shikimate 5'-dehydrogenase C-terminal domain